MTSQSPREVSQQHMSRGVFSNGEVFDGWVYLETSDSEGKWIPKKEWEDMNFEAQLSESAEEEESEIGEEDVEVEAEEDESVKSFSGRPVLTGALAKKHHSEDIVGFWVDCSDGSRKYRLPTKAWRKPIRKKEKDLKAPTFPTSLMPDDYRHDLEAKVVEWSVFPEGVEGPWVGITWDASTTIEVLADSDYGLELLAKELNVAIKRGQMDLCDRELRTALKTEQEVAGETMLTDKIREYEINSFGGTRSTTFLKGRQVLFMQIKYLEQASRYTFVTSGSGQGGTVLAWMGDTAEEMKEFRKMVRMHRHWHYMDGEQKFMMVLQCVRQTHDEALRNAVSQLEYKPEGCPERT